MSDDASTVGIGLPVRNGSRYIEQAVRSVLAQDHESLQLLISDNASTDDTIAICERLAGSDPRLRLEPLAVNIGAAGNFNRVFDRSEGQYFAWAAHDDRYHPAFLSTCLGALDQAPGAAFAVPGVRFIDEDDREIGRMPAAPDLGSPILRIRLHTFLDRHEWFSIYGVWRRDALAATSRMGAFYGSDVLLQWEALLRAPAVAVPDFLVDYRRFTGKSHGSVLSGLLPEGTPQTMRWAHIRFWRRLHDATRGSDIELAAGRTARGVLYRWLRSVHFRELLWADAALEAKVARERPSVVRCSFWILIMGILRPRRTARNLRRLGGRAVFRRFRQ